MISGVVHQKMKQINERMSFEARKKQQLVRLLDRVLDNTTTRPTRSKENNIYCKQKIVVRGLHLSNDSAQIQGYRSTTDPN